MIPETIALQLGGAFRLKLFIGAYHILSCDNNQALSFRFVGSTVANYVKITLTTSDLYDIEFKQVVDLEVKDAGEYKGVYCDQLVSLFEDHTGLFLHL